MFKSNMLMVLLLVVPQLGSAGFRIEFIESAPKDIFIISNETACEATGIKLLIDLEPSVGRLIFDTSPGGKGIEVFQPFETLEGRITLEDNSQVNDGDSRLALNINNIASNGQAKFTIDVDDQLAESPLGNTRVDHSEIQSARISLKVDKPLFLSEALFDSSSQAYLDGPDCSR